MAASAAADKLGQFDKWVEQIFGNQGVVFKDATATIITLVVAIGGLIGAIKTFKYLLQTMKAAGAVKDAIVGGRAAGSVAGMMSDAEKRLFSISNEGAKRHAESPAPIMSRLLNRLESAKGSNGLTGVPSGFTTLDRRTGGWQDSDLIGLAARPSMGKTGLAVNFMVEAAKMGYPVGFFSLEMSSSQLMTRVLAAEAGIDSKKMMRGQLEEYEWQQLHSSMERVSDLPFYIDETPAISIVEARSKCIKMKMQYGIRLFIFD